MAATAREQVEGALRTLGFKPSQVRAGLAALAGDDARPVAVQLKDAIRHVDDPEPPPRPKAEPPKPKAAEPSKPKATEPPVERPDPLARFGPRRPAPAPPPGYMRRANAHVAARAKSDRELARAAKVPRLSWRRVALVGLSLGLPVAALLIFGRERTRDKEPEPTKPAPRGAPPQTPPPAVGEVVKVVVPRSGLNANLRSKPGRASAVVAGVRSGTEATIAEARTVGRERWYRVDTTSATGGAVSGWLHGSLVPGAST